jgi:hypothetical protein
MLILPARCAASNDGCWLTGLIVQLWHHGQRFFNGPCFRLKAGSVAGRSPLKVRAGAHLILRLSRRWSAISASQQHRFPHYLNTSRRTWQHAFQANGLPNLRIFSRSTTLINDSVEHLRPETNHIRHFLWVSSHGSPHFRGIITLGFKGCRIYFDVTGPF